MAIHPIETKCVKIRLKKGSLDKVENWKNFIIDNKDEALKTLKQEGVLVEAVFLDKGEDADYLIYFMSANDLKKASEVVKNSQNIVDECHQNFKKECWEDGYRLETLVTFYNL